MSDDQALRELAFDTHGAAEAARASRNLVNVQLRGRTSGRLARGKGRQVHDMASAQQPLPGPSVRNEGDAPTGDPAIDEAYDNSGVAYDFFKAVFDRKSLDGHGYPLVSSIRYGTAVSDAIWTGEQMLFGEGDGRFFQRFTRALDIVVHEFSHGVIGFSSNLAYDGQSGALNESFCDVMGALAVQWRAAQSFDQADWMMGREILGPALSGLAGVRTFRKTRAFEGHPDLGDDPQPKHMNDFVTTTQDYGGVHLNSGIPNHAFYLAAEALGGQAWDRAGKIWFQAFTQLATDSDFKSAAAATVRAARKLYARGGAEERAVTEAWRAVGVEPEV